MSRVLIAALLPLLLVRGQDAVPGSVVSTAPIASILTAPSTAGPLTQLNGAAPTDTSLDSPSQTFDQARAAADILAAAAAIVASRNSLMSSAAVTSTGTGFTTLPESTSEENEEDDNDDDEAAAIVPIVAPAVGGTAPVIETGIEGSSDPEISPSDTTDARTSSPSSCAETTTREAEFTTCSPLPVTSDGATTTTEVCETSTSTVSGCDNTVTGSATTLSASDSAETLCAMSCEACNPQPTGVSAIRRRDAVGDEILQKRTLEDVPSDRYEQYMIDFSWNRGQFAKANGNPIEYVEHSQNSAETQFGRTTARFAKLEDKRYNLMVQGLWGCTSIVIISRLGVYMSHIWEDPTFIDNDHFNDDIEMELFGGAPAEAGRAAMPNLDDLFLGDGNRPFKLQGAEEWAGLADGNTITAFVITPHVTEDPSTLRYPDKIETITDRLNELLEAASEELDPDSTSSVEYKPAVVVPYQKMAPPEHTDHTKTPLGKVLFQYDPNQPTDTFEWEHDGHMLECPTQHSAARLFVMDNPKPVYWDEWTTPMVPFEDILEKRKLHARQDSDVALSCRQLNVTAPDDSSTAEAEWTPGGSFVSTKTGTASTLSTIIASASTEPSEAPTEATSAPSSTEQQEDSPPPPYQTGTCNVHIKQASKGGTWLSAEATVTDADNELATAENDDMRLGLSDESLKIEADASKLPWDVEVTFPREASTVSDDWSIDFAWVVRFKAGETEWSSEDRDESEEPYCKVELWDHEAFSNRATGAAPEPATREMDYSLKATLDKNKTKRPSTAQEPESYPHGTMEPTATTIAPSNTPGIHIHRTLPNGPAAQLYVQALNAYLETLPAFADLKGPKMEHSPDSPRPHFLPEGSVLLYATEASGSDGGGGGETGGEHEHTLGALALMPLRSGMPQFRGLNLDSGNKVESAAEIKRMFVFPSARGKGIARLLIAEAERVAREEMGTRLLVVETLRILDGAQGLYRAVGFRERGVWGGYDERDSVCFEKWLG